MISSMFFVSPATRSSIGSGYSRRLQTLLEKHLDQELGLRLATYELFIGFCSIMIFTDVMLIGRFPLQFAEFSVVGGRSASFQFNFKAPDL